MRRPERGGLRGASRAVHGPDRPTLRDIDALNRVFTESFTDRYGRDGLVGVRVPHLNPVVWRYAIEDADGGAMVWRDSDGQMVAFNMVHQSGTEGWMGPLAVRPDRQNQGMGTLMVQAGIDWLKNRRATVIGLETMPRTVDNIGFYSRLGFAPRYLTVTLTRDLAERSGRVPSLLSTAPAGVSATLEASSRLTARIVPGADFSRELVLTHELHLGDTTLAWRGSHLAGFALWHSAPLAASRPKDELRILKLVAEDIDTFDRLLDGVQDAANMERARRTALRCQTAFVEAYSHLIDLGYRVHWTDLRMTLSGYHELRPSSGIVMSNWEI